MSGRLDSNQRPPAPKAGALTGLRYTPLSRLFRCMLHRSACLEEAACRCESCRSLHPADAGVAVSLPGRLVRCFSGTPGCKDSGFFGADQLFAPKSFGRPGVELSAGGSACCRSGDATRYRSRPSNRWPKSSSGAGMYTWNPSARAAVTLRSESSMKSVRSGTMPLSATILRKMASDGFSSRSS